MAQHDRSHRFGRTLITAAVGAAILLIAAIGGAASVGAAPPTNVFTANGCPVGNYDCLGVGPYSVGAYGVLPEGGHWVGNRYYYRDNRYCGDGELFFQNGGYFCANGVPVSGVVPILGGTPIFTGYPGYTGVVGLPVAYYGTARTCTDARYVWIADRGCVWRG